MASMKFEVEVESRKLIKPCTPTPPHLRSYKISMMDELNPSIHVIRILYYPRHSAINDAKLINLEESLAGILPLFYPLAGRYMKDKHLVDCNDEGAEFSHASVDCDLLPLIASGVAADQLNHLLPLQIGEVDDPTDPILGVRVNRFQCGGLAIGICLSHRISDSASLGIFLSAWADAVSGRESVIRPDFDMPPIFPSENHEPLPFGVSRTRDTSIVCKRIVFDKNAIAGLRDGVTPDWKAASGGRPPSRVVVVSAVLSQALLRADRAKNGKSRASVIGQAINVRERTVPPVPKDAWGTCYLLYNLESSAEESRRLETDFQGMVRIMREATMQGIKTCSRVLSDKDFARQVWNETYFGAAEKAESPDYKDLYITDWSKFGEYELDFGFGKPVWVSLAAFPVKDMLILMNTKDNDGIEAWVYLHESDMAYFEKDDQVRMLTALETIKQ